MRGIAPGTLTPGLLLLGLAYACEGLRGWDVLTFHLACASVCGVIGICAVCGCEFFGVCACTRAVCTLCVYLCVCVMHVCVCVWCVHTCVLCVWCLCGSVYVCVWCVWHIQCMYMCTVCVACVYVCAVCISV